MTVQNPTPESNSIPTYLATAMRSSLCKIDPRMRLHKRMYKDATIRSGDTSNPSEIEIKDILFDTGASHSSYISKDLVDKYRSEWKDKIRPVEARVTLADNTTQIPIIEEIELDMTFYYDANSGTAQACVWMFIINSPGKTIIIGLPDIVVHFYYLFTEMVNIAREDYRRIQRKEEKGQLTNNVSSLKPIDLQLPIEGLEEPFIPWNDSPWVIAQDEMVNIAREDYRRIQRKEDKK